MRESQLDKYIKSESYQEDLMAMRRAQREEPCLRCQNVGNYVCPCDPCPAWAFETRHTHLCDCTPGGGAIAKKKYRLKKLDEEGGGYANGY